MRHRKKKKRKKKRINALNIINKAGETVIEENIKCQSKSQIAKCQSIAESALLEIF